MAKFGVSVAVTEEGTAQRAQYENLPNGVYSLHMEAAEIVEKNEGNPDHSIMLKSTFEVLEPEEYKGRKLFGNYNLKNKSPKAQTIGNEQFQSLLRSIGMDEINEDSETDELLFIAFTAKVGLGKDSEEKNADGTPKWAAKPEIKTYYFPDMDDAPEIAVVAGQVAANDNRPAANDNRKPAPAAAAKPAGSKPWKKAA